MSVSRAEGYRAKPWSVGLLRKAMDRDHFFAALFAVGCANGFANAVITDIQASGWWQALFQTFGISALVWVACGAGVFLLLHQSRDHLRPADALIGLGSLFLFALP